jgi:NTP pyrophosphatase (non-canonical NTP hydrolase)
VSEVKEITDKLIKFRDERDWAQFHNSKDLALAISVEAGELLELFLWKHADEVNLQKIKEELADVFAFAFLLAEKHQLNVRQIMIEKIEANAKKYPIDKAKGSAKKYTEL